MLLRWGYSSLIFSGRCKAFLGDDVTFMGVQIAVTTFLESKTGNPDLSLLCQATGTFSSHILEMWNN